MIITGYPQALSPTMYVKCKDVSKRLPQSGIIYSTGGSVFGSLKRYDKTEGLCFPMPESSMNHYPAELR